MTVGQKRRRHKISGISDDTRSKRLNEHLHPCSSSLCFALHPISTFSVVEKFLQESRRSRKNIPNIFRYARRKREVKRSEFGSRETEIEFPFQWSTQHADRQIITPTRDEPLSIILQILRSLRVLFMRQKSFEKEKVLAVEEVKRIKYKIGKMLRYDATSWRAQGK